MLFLSFEILLKLILVVAVNILFNILLSEIDPLMTWSVEY